MNFFGTNSRVSKDASISKDVELVLGDHVYIGPGTRILGKGKVFFGDYSKIHDGCFINVPNHDSIIKFGCNTWIGERVVLDGTGGICASHNVGVGIASHLYSHIAHGDVLRGCRYHSKNQLNIEKDAWLVGQCLVSPVNIGEKSMAMLGSTITRDMLPNTVYAGVPARDMTEKLGRPWGDPPKEQRLKTFNQYLSSFLKENNEIEASIVGVDHFPTNIDSSVSYFNVMSGTYTKRFSEIEQKFMLWLTSYKARFIPEGM